MSQKGFVSNSRGRKSCELLQQKSKWLRFEGESMEKLASTIEEVHQEELKSLLQISGVHAAGIGPKRIAGEFSEILSIVLLVEKKLPKSEINDSDLIPKEIGGFQTDVIESPRMKSREMAAAALAEKDPPGADSKMYNPLVSGCRISATKGTGWGTLGAIVQDANGSPAILTAKHVVKDYGSVYQPGQSEREIAAVTNLNGYDWCYCRLKETIEWTNYILEVGPIQGDYVVTVGDLPYPVVKRGYKTGFSTAKITIAMLCGYDNDGKYFSSSMYVEGASNTLLGGDSGSVIVDDQYRIVGMIYDSVNPAGTEAVAASIDVIKADLGISVVKTNYPPLYMVFCDSGDNGCRESENINGRWNGVADLHMGTTWGPAVINYKNQLFCIRQGTDGYVLMCSTNNGTGWTKDTSLGAGCTWRPGLAVYNGLLYCIHQGSDANGQAFCMTYDGQKWTGDQQLPFGISGWAPPALVTWRGKLHCFRMSGEYNGNIMHTAFDGRSWSQDTMLAPTNDPSNFYGTCSAPAVVAYQGLLYCVHNGNSGDHSARCSTLFYFTFDGATWSADTDLHAGCTIGPSLIVKDDLLYCFHQGFNWANELFYLTCDNGKWGADTLLEPSDYQPLDCPGLAFLPDDRPLDK